MLVKAEMAPGGVTHQARQGRRESGSWRETNDVVVLEVATRHWRLGTSIETETPCWSPKEVLGCLQETGESQSTELFTYCRNSH